MKTLILIFSSALLLSGFNVSQAADGDKDGPRVYMPYAKCKDHMVVGVEIPGYHMRYDIAQRSNIFMVLLPDGFDDMNATPVYFSIDTFALDNHTVKEIFENDIKTLTRENPALKIVNKFDGEKLSKAGECYGAEFAHPKESKFPHEVFYFCKNKSDKYVIMMSIGAKDKRSLSNHLPNFIKWANAPQIVTDYKVVEFPSNGMGKGDCSVKNEKSPESKQK